MRRAIAGVSASVLWCGLMAPPVAAEPFVHVHASQRFDRGIPLLARDIGRFARPPASLLTVTEVLAPERRAQLHGRPGWRGYTSPRTDVGLMWRLNRWRAYAAVARRVTDRTYVTRNGFRRTTVVLAVALAPRVPYVGPRVLVTLGHPPPHRLPYWRSVVAGWSELVGKLRARWRVGAVLTVADWNVSLRAHSWRRALSRAFPGRLTWRAPLPRNGTHGMSLIDATITTLTGRARLLPHTAASDHTAYRERLSLDD